MSVSAAVATLLDVRSSTRDKHALFLQAAAFAVFRAKVIQREMLCPWETSDGSPVIFSEGEFIKTEDLGRIIHPKRKGKK